SIGNSRIIGLLRLPFPLAQYRVSRRRASQAGTTRGNSPWNCQWPDFGRVKDTGTETFVRDDVRPPAPAEIASRLGLRSRGCECLRCSSSTRCESSRESLPTGEPPPTHRLDERRRSSRSCANR